MDYGRQPTLRAPQFRAETLHANEREVDQLRMQRAQPLQRGVVSSHTVDHEGRSTGSGGAIGDSAGPTEAGGVRPSRRARLRAAAPRDDDLESGRAPRFLMDCTPGNSAPAHGATHQTEAA